LKETMLPEATIGNPVDVVATGGGIHFRSAMDVLLAEDDIDSIYINFVTAPFVDTDEVARQIVAVSQLRKKPVVCNFMTNMSLERFRETAKILKEGGVPCYSYPTAAAKALGALYRYSKIRSRVLGQAKSFADIDEKKAEVIITQAKKEGKEFLAADRVYELLGAYGIPVAKWWLANDVYEAVNAADGIGYPVVLKAEAESVVHKSDIGGVAINLRSKEEVKAAADNMKSKLGVKSLKFLVQKFLPGGKELIMGVSVKEGLGHLVMFGIGGIYVEILKDVIFKIAPVTETEAKEMLVSIKASKLLDGVRGDEAINKEAVADIIQRLSRLVTDFPVIKEMDLNPVMAFSDTAYIVDARIKIK
jgi:acetate---CoA ligase (ADP-forming)